MTLETDVSEFKTQMPDFTKQGNKLILKHEEIEDFVKNQTEKPFSKSIFLGKQEKEFKPSNYLITLIQVKDNFFQVDEEREWLFLCGRDIFQKNLDSKNLGNKIIIKNKYDENIGIALVQKNILKNITDIGTYIRD